jgi:hypothetical protein
MRRSTQKFRALRASWTRVWPAARAEQAMAAAARAAERPADWEATPTTSTPPASSNIRSQRMPPRRRLTASSAPSRPRTTRRRRRGRAAPTRAAGPDAGPDADASPMGERGLEASSLLDVLLGGAEEEEDMLSPSPAASRRRPLPPDDRRLSSPSDCAATLPTARVQWSICAHTSSTLIHLRPHRLLPSSHGVQLVGDGGGPATAATAAMVTRPATGTARQHGGTVTDAPVGWCGAVSVQRQRERERESEILREREREERGRTGECNGTEHGGEGGPCAARLIFGCVNLRQHTRAGVNRRNLFPSDSEEPREKRKRPPALALAT